jgi:hypothetical protein
VLVAVLAGLGYENHLVDPGLLVAFSEPGHLRWRSDRTAQRARVAALDQLHDWIASGSARAYMRDPACHPIRTPGYSFRPYLRLWLDIPPRAVSFDKADFAPNAPLLLLPTSTAAYERTMLRDLGRRSRAAITASPVFKRDYRRVAVSSRWELFADPACRAAHAPVTA